MINLNEVRGFHRPFLPLARGLGEESEEINLPAMLGEPSPRPRRV